MKGVEDHLSWKDVGKEILKNIVIGVTSVLCIKAVKNVINGKDILGRTPDPKETRVNYKGQIVLGEDDYTVV